MSSYGHSLVPERGVIVPKLDGVGPVDNRPSNDKLHHFVKKKINKYIKKNCDM